jgi:hypothetical protein
MQLPRCADWDQHYFRFLADYRLELEIDGQKASVFSGRLAYRPAQPDAEGEQ